MYADDDNQKRQVKGILGIILTAAAAALCVAIDMILKEDEEP